MDGQGTKWRRNIAENFNCLSRVHERYRQTSDGRTTAYSERERRLKTQLFNQPTLNCSMSSDRVAPAYDVLKFVVMILLLMMTILLLLLLLLLHYYATLAAERICALTGIRRLSVSVVI